MLTITLADVLSSSTLFEAWTKVSSNNGAGGTDGITLADFAADLQNNLALLRNEVEHETYRPLPLLRVEIDKPSGDGKRLLLIPTIRDRVLQTAVTLVLTPLFEEEFEDISFAYRKGRSVEQALNRVSQLRDQGYQWVVDADIHRYFDEVDHKLLMIEVEKLVSDPGILRLIRQWLTATVLDGKQCFRLTKGIPQGSPLSPLLANLFLDHLDETLLDNNLRMVRYGDDFVVLCKTADKAEQALALTAEVLDQLRLGFNEHKTRIVDFNQGFRFLGVTFIRSMTVKNKAKKLTTGGSRNISPQNPPYENKERTKPNHSVIKTANNISPTQSTNINPSKIQKNEMQMAFVEAGISPGQFPSEAEPDESFEPPAQQTEVEISTSNEPRLKTLYLVEPGSVLAKQYERFVIQHKGKVVKEIPAIHVDQIMVFGNSQLTTQVMQFCLRQRIPVFLLSGKGRYYGMVDSFDTEPVLLHKEQFLRADDKAFCLQLAQQFIKGKISNSRLLLKRQSRHKDAPALEKASTELAGVIKQLDAASSLDQLRGYEGNAAKIYFQAIAATLDKRWEFNRRNKKPPTDPLNALFSYGYTLLFYNIYTLLRVRGLNPHVGYLHPIRMGHPALASDMMEEFRSIVVDAVVLNLITNEKLSPDDFKKPQQEGEACFIKPEARALFIRHLEAKMNAAIRHPVSQLKLDYRRCMEHQINHLAAVVRQRQVSYQPMILR